MKTPCSPSREALREPNQASEGASRETGGAPSSGERVPVRHDFGRTVGARRSEAAARSTPPTCSPDPITTPSLRADLDDKTAMLMCPHAADRCCSPCTLQRAPGCASAEPREPLTYPGAWLFPPPSAGGGGCPDVKGRRRPIPSRPAGNRRGSLERKTMICEAQMGRSADCVRGARCLWTNK